jgi:hypothetical protein
MTVFLPHLGTFGDLIRDHLPWLWAHYAPGDVIGGHPAHAVLYPAPPDPRLWAPVAAAYPTGFDHRIPDEPVEAAVRRCAADLFPTVSLRARQPDGEHYHKPAIPLPPPQPIDLVLAPRRKPWADAKTGWPWAELASRLRSAGYRVGLVGSQAESEPIPADAVAWEHPDGDLIGSLALLRGARCVVTLDSAMSHLASLVDAPQVVIYPSRGDERRALPIAAGAPPVPMRFADMHRWNQRLCLPAWGGPEQVLAAIDEALAARVIPGSIDAWKSRHLSHLPDAPPIAVIREANRSLIMRPSGNDLIETTPLDERLPPPSPAEIERRAAACRACPHYRADSDRCGLCGCAFVIAERVASPVARCPEGRW